MPNYIVTIRETETGAEHRHEVYFQDHDQAEAAIAGAIRALSTPARWFDELHWAPVETQHPDRLLRGSLLGVEMVPTGPYPGRMVRVPVEVDCNLPVDLDRTRIMVP